MGSSLYLFNSSGIQVSLIGRSDFPDKWPELLPNLVAKLNTDNFDVINGVMQTANSLFKRYEHLPYPTYGQAY